MAKVVLKGFKNGYELIIKTDVSLEQAYQELEELLKKLQADTKLTTKKKVTFNINTKERLLSAQEKQKLEELFKKYPQFIIHRFLTDVITLDNAQKIMQKNMIHMCSDVIRNGQVKTIDGDVLFLGSIHQGGILQAKGSIYVLGEAEGILHAGYQEEPRAVIVGNIKNAQQVRIADLIDVLEDNETLQDENFAIYVNDLHNLAYAEVFELKSLRPGLFAQMGGF